MTQEYETFDEDSACGATLPVQIARDEYRFVKFVRLTAGGDALQLPSHALVTAAQLKQLSEPVKEVLRGAKSFSDAWVVPEVLGAPPRVTVRLSDLLATHRVTAGGGEHRVTLTGEEVRALLGRLPVAVQVGEGDGARALVLVADEEEPANGYAVVHVDDLPSFLADPRLPTGEAVTLTESAINALLGAGVGAGRYARPDGEGSAFIVAETSSPAALTGVPRLRSLNGGPVGIGSTSSALMVSPGSGPPSSHVGGGSVDLAHGGPETTPVPGYPFALLMPYRQRWTLLGYTRGELLNSIALAPQEEATIEIFSWDRRRTQEEEALSDESETSAQLNYAKKNTLDVVKETVRGNDWKMDDGARIGVTVDEVLDAGFDVSQTTQKKLTESSKKTQGSIAEGTLQGATRIKSSRQVKVTETQEYGSETRVTRKVRNNNMVRTLNLDYFEILASYTVSTELDDAGVRLCVLTDNLLPGPLTRAFVLQHEGTLKRVLLSETYRPGFEAAKFLAAFERHCEIAWTHACSCEVPPQEVATPEVTQAAQALYVAVDTLFGATFELYRDANDLTSAPHLRRYLYRTLAIERACPTFCNVLSRWWAKGITTALTLSALHQVLSAPREQTLSVVDLPSAMLGDYAEVMAELGTRLGYPKARRLAADAGFDDGGLNAALCRARTAFAALGHSQPPPTDMTGSGIQKPQGAHQTSGGGHQPPGKYGVAQQKSIIDDVGDWVGSMFSGGQSTAKVTTTDPPSEPVEAPPPELPLLPAWIASVLPTQIDGYDVRMLSAATVFENQLLGHLRLNEAFYRHAVWQSIAPEDRYNLLRARGDNLSGYVENEIVGFVGRQAAMPFRLEKNATVAEWFRKAVAENADLLNAKPGEHTVTIPTKGMSVQARLGACDAAEDFVIDHRKLDVQMRGAEVEQAKQQARQEELEAKRMQMRLDKADPDLSDPTPNDGSTPIRISLDKTE
jgi:hypothetical protein